MTDTREETGGGHWQEEEEFSFRYAEFGSGGSWIMGWLRVIIFIYHEMNSMGMDVIMQNEKKKKTNGKYLRDTNI